MNLPEVFKNQVQHTETLLQERSIALRESMQQSTDMVFHSLSNATEQTGKYVGNGLQGAIDSSFGDWLEHHPGFFRLFHFLNWGITHPIWSLILLVFALALIFSVIKGIGRVFERIGVSVLQIPLKLLGTILRYIYYLLKEAFKYILDKSGFNRSKIANQFKAKHINSQSQVDFINIEQISNQKNSEKQRRLGEISDRLSQIQQEQNQLLQEAASILNTDTNSNKNSNKQSDINSHQLEVNELEKLNINNLDINLEESTKSLQDI